VAMWINLASAFPPNLWAAQCGVTRPSRIVRLVRPRIETSIIVPGAFTGGTNHFAHAGPPADEARAAEYEAGPYAGFADQVRTGFASIVPADADVSAVAAAIVRLVDTPFGKGTFRVHIDPTRLVRRPGLKRGHSEASQDESGRVSEGL